MSTSIRQPRGMTEDRFFLDLLDNHEKTMDREISAKMRQDIEEMLRLQSGMSLPVGTRRIHRQTHITPETRLHLAEKLRTEILNGFAVCGILPKLRKEEI